MPRCVECKKVHYGSYPICKDCYQSNRLTIPTVCKSCGQLVKPTKFAIALCKELRSKGVPAELEKCDKYKHIDLAIVDAKVNIEVDGPHHNLDSAQALRDLYRTLYSFKKGYVTLRIPNCLVNCDQKSFEEAADLILEFLNTRNRQRSQE